MQYRLNDGCLTVNIISTKRLHVEMYQIELLQHCRFSRVKQTISHKMNSLEKTKDECYRTVLIRNKLHQTLICTSAHHLRCTQYAIIVWRLPRSGEQRRLILLSMYGRIQDFLFYVIERSGKKASFSSSITGQNVSLLSPMYTEHRCRHIAMSDKLRLRFLKGKSLFLAIGNCEIKPDPCNSTFICVLDAPPLAVSSLFSLKIRSTSRHAIEMSM